MKLLAATLVCLFGVSGLVESQGFLGNCTWQSANLTGSFLGMYCNDDDIADYGYQWTCTLYILYPVTSLPLLPTHSFPSSAQHAHELFTFATARI